MNKPLDGPTPIVDALVNSGPQWYTHEALVARARHLERRAAQVLAMNQPKEGWVLVPKAMTPKMKRTIEEYRRDGLNCASPENVWAELLQRAAPKPKAQKQGSR